MMNGMANTLRVAFQDYRSMQDQLMREFNNGLPVDWETHIFERAKFFENLKTELTLLLQKVTTSQKEDAHPIVTDLKKELTLIQEKDVRLSQKILRYRNALDQKRQKIRTGKSLINGYRPYHSSSQVRMMHYLS